MFLLNIQGMFSTTLTGPGQVWMQSLNFQKFRDAIQETVVEDGTMDRGANAGGQDVN